jgi:hypothetical protein
MNHSLNSEVKKTGSIVPQPSTPPFLLQMRKRQMERAEKREEIRKYHELKEEEKRRQEFENETQRLQNEAEVKLKKAKQRKELRKQEKLYLKKQEADAEKWRISRLKAKEFRTKNLLGKFGLQPWKQLISEIRMNEFYSEKHFEKSLIKRAFHDWLHMTKSNQIMRRIQAEELDRYVSIAKL